MYTHQVQNGIRRCLLVLTVIFSACGTHAQFRSVPSSISLTAKLEGFVILTDVSLPLSVTVRNGGQVQVKVPIEVTWNLDPQVTQSFRVIGSFQQRKSALASGLKTVTPADIQARLEQTEFRPFREKRNDLVLFNVTLDQANRRGHMQRMLELRLTERALSTLPDGVYQGRLDLEVQEQH